MEEKFKNYRKYDWTLSKEWSTYLDNIFPTPTRDRLEKMRRKWYRDKIDKDFDINYEPSATTEGESSRARSSSGAY